MCSGVWNSFGDVLQFHHLWRMYEQSRSTLRVVCIGADMQSRTLLPEWSRARTLGARSREVYRVCFFDFKLNGRRLSTQCKLVMVGSDFKYFPPLQQSLLNIVNIYLKIYPYQIYSHHSRLLALWLSQIFHHPKITPLYGTSCYMAMSVIYRLCCHKYESHTISHLSAQYVLGETL